jgi:hypothetical protein
MHDVWNHTACTASNPTFMLVPAVTIEARSKPDLASCDSLSACSPDYNTACVPKAKRSASVQIQRRGISGRGRPRSSCPRKYLPLYRSTARHCKPLHVSALLPEYFSHRSGQPAHRTAALFHGSTDKLHTTMMNVVQHLRGAALALSTLDTILLGQSTSRISRSRFEQWKEPFEQEDRNHARRTA